MSSSDSKILDPEVIISHHFPQTTFTYTERDVALYALGVGACIHNALDEKELKYVYNKDGQSSIEVLPTFAALFPYKFMRGLQQLPGLQSKAIGDIFGIPQRVHLISGSFESSSEHLWYPIPSKLYICECLLRYDPSFFLHGQQYIEIYKPLQSSGSITNKTEIAGLHDKGKATILEIDTTSYDKESGELLCLNRNTIYLRGAGGFSKSSPLYSYSKYPNNQVSAVKIPTDKPFAVYEECAHPSQALLYRLSGDENPLHSDPTVAHNAGFSHPILHGLCTLGFAVRAVIKCIGNGDPTSVKSLMGRFLLHVYPGETLITEMWLEDSRVLYQMKVRERDLAVLSGYVVLNRASSLM